MTNGESTYIGMSLPEGIRYITVFEKGDFENCGRILRTFYSTEDRVKIARFGKPAPFGRQSLIK